MKTITFAIIALLFTFSIQAQNTNKKTETTTTTNTKKDSDGVHKTVKKEVTKESQNIELKEEKPNTLNIEMKDSPVNSVSTTKITNPDGTTRTVDVDRSSYYVSNGTKYKLELDASGYVISYGNNKPALLRRTSTNSFVYRANNETSIAYFDTLGNLIIETYDSKADKVYTDVYTIVKE